jgi:hypothetical protein
MFRHWANNGIQMSDITNKFIEFLDDGPDKSGRRMFMLSWDDMHAFAPGAKRNPDGSVTRAQIFHSRPEKHLAEGFVERRRIKQGELFELV